MKNKQGKYPLQMSPLLAGLMLAGALSSNLGGLTAHAAETAAAQPAAPAAAAPAVTVHLPQVAPPPGFESEESSPRSLTRSELTDLQPWAENSQAQLKELLNQIQGLDPVQSHVTLVRELESILTSSASKRTEALMRSVIERGLKINHILSEKDGSAQALYAENAILTQSADLAIEYYKNDLNYLQGAPAPTENIEYAIYGRDYSSFLMEVDQGILNAQAQFEMALNALKLLEWDMFRDARLRYDLAPQIVKIDHFVQGLAKQTRTDDIARVYDLRRIRKLYREVHAELTNLTPFVPAAVIALAVTGENKNEPDRTEPCNTILMASSPAGYVCNQQGAHWRVENELYRGHRVYRYLEGKLKVAVLTETVGGNGHHMNADEAAKSCRDGFHVPTGYPHRFNGAQYGFPDKDSEFETLIKGGFYTAIPHTDSQFWSRTAILGGENYFFNGANLVNDEHPFTRLSVLCVSDK